jgi:hypothetical protein
MGIDADSKGSVLDTRPSHGHSLQPATSNHSKAAEADGAHANRSIMATIADDDDRLLVRIGYTPVSAS